MKNIKSRMGICFGFLVTSLGLIFITIGVGCGQQSTAPAPITPGITVSITGVLTTGLLPLSAYVGPSGVKAQATAKAVQGYNVVAVSKDTGKIYFASAETDASGKFVIPNLPTGESFYLDILNSDNKLVAPVAFGTTEGKPVMAVNSGTSDLDLGTIIYSTSDQAAAPATPPTTSLDISTSAEAKSGKILVPTGAGNFGKGSETEIASGTYNSNVADGDKDGLPNILDADNNGDLIADEFDGLYTEEVFGITNPPNFHAYVFTNLKVDWNQRDTFKNYYETFTIALGVTPNNKPGFTPKTIASCKLISGPSWISKAYVVSDASRTLWSNSNYEIPKKPGMGDVFEVQLSGNPPTSTLKPGVDVTAGDAMKIKVTYTDGTSEESIKMINFVFTDIPRVIGYKFGTGPWQTGSINFPTNAPTSEVTLRWTRPLDESSREVIGGRYTFEYNSTMGGAIETTVITKDADATLTSLEATVNYATLPYATYEAVGSPPHYEFMLGVCIRSVANDNSAENIRFQKDW